jgi:hypothetical protein
VPPNLSHLCIRGYKKGLNREHDVQIQVLKSHYDSGLLNLKELTGIDELIPNAEHVKNPINNEHLLWKFEEIRYGVPPQDLGDE